VLPQTGFSQGAAIQPLQILNAPDPVIERLIAQRQVERAEAILVHELSNDPRNDKRLLMLAQVYFDQHPYAEASSILASANQIAGPTANEEVLAGLIEIVHEDFAAAEKHHRNAISLDPKNAEAHYYLGRDLYTRQSVVEAISEFKTAISLGSSLLRAYDGVGLAYQALGKKDDAIHWFQEGMDQEKRISGARSEWPPLHYATFLLNYEATDRVDQLLKLSLSRNPLNPETYYQYGNYYYKLARYGDAIRMLRRAIELDPSSPQAHYLCGRSYHVLHEAH
jgi:cytochrome c-type biogenesis protein CcmH/NrfG